MVRVSTPLSTVTNPYYRILRKKAPLSRDGAVAELASLDLFLYAIVVVQRNIYPVMYNMCTHSTHITSRD